MTKGSKYKAGDWFEEYGMIRIIEYVFTNNSNTLCYFVSYYGSSWTNIVPCHIFEAMFDKEVTPMSNEEKAFWMLKKEYERIIKDA